MLALASLNSCSGLAEDSMLDVGIAAVSPSLTKMLFVGELVLNLAVTNLVSGRAGVLAVVS